MQRTQPLSLLMDEIFGKDKTIKVIFAELDPGVDDTVAAAILLAKTMEKKSTGRRFEILGFVPTAGNAVLKDTAQNIGCILELAGREDIPLYPGAPAPLFALCNESAIKEVEKDINGFPFYGPHGWPESAQRETICPGYTARLQSRLGYQFIADSVEHADSPLILFSTSAVTVLSKALSELVWRAKLKGIDPRNFTKNIGAIFAMGGVIDIKFANAPFNWPHCNSSFAIPPSDPCQNSEANFFWDSLATKTFFEISNELEIKIILATLDLTEQDKLLWGQIKPLI